MRRYYSMEAIAQDDLVLPEHRIALGAGLNVFTFVTDDLPTILCLLESAGVEIKNIYALDHFKKTPQGELSYLEEESG